MDILPGNPSQNHHIDLMTEDSPVYLAYSPKGGSDTLKGSKAFEELLFLGKQAQSLQATPLLRDTNPFNDLYSHSPANKSAEVKHYSPLKGSSWGNRMDIVEKNESENEESPEVQENDRQDQEDVEQEVQPDNLLNNVKDELSAGLRNQPEELHFHEEVENNMKTSQERHVEVEDIPTVHLDQEEDMRTPFDTPFDESEAEVKPVSAPSYNGFYQEHQRAQEKIKSIQELLASAQNELKKSQARTKKFSNDENLVQKKPLLYPELKTSGMDFTSQAVPTMVVRTSSRDFQNDKENMRILSNIEPQKMNAFFAPDEVGKENRRILGNIDQNKMESSEKSTEITKRVCSNIDNMIDKYLNEYRSPRNFTAQSPTAFRFASAENQDGTDMMKRSNASFTSDLMKRSNASLYNSAFYQDNAQVNADPMKRSNASLYNSAYNKENLPTSSSNHFHPRRYSVAHDENQQSENVGLDAMRFKSVTGRLETYEKPKIFVTAATQNFEYGTIHLENEEKPVEKEIFAQEVPKVLVSAAPEEEDLEHGTIQLEDEERPVVEKEASAKKSVNMNNFVEEKEEDEGEVAEENIHQENTYSDHDDVVFHDIEELNLGGQMDSPVKEHNAERIAEVYPTSPSEGRQENFVEEFPVDTEEAEELARVEKEEEERIEQEIFYSYEQERVEDFAFPMPRNTERLDCFKVEEVNPEELEGRQGTEEDGKDMFFEDVEKEELNLDDEEGVFFDEQDEEINVDEADKKLMGLSFKDDERQEINLMDYYEPAEAEIERKPVMNGFQINIPSSQNNFEDMLDVTSNTFFDFDREKLEMTERRSIRPPVSTKRRKYIAKTIWNTNQIYTQGRTERKMPILSFVFQKFDGPNAVFNPKVNTNFWDQA